MVTKFKFVAVLMAIFVLCGCSSNNIQSSDVHLCDYKNITVTEEMYEVSEADLDTALTMYAISTEESLEDHTALTDEIVRQYFGFESVPELREQALHDMVSHRIADAVYAEILLNSHMDFNPNDSNFKRYYSNRMSSIDYLSKQENETVAAFLEHTYQMTESEFKESEIDFYVTVCIVKEILNAENHSNLQDDIDRNRSYLAQELGCSIEETYNILLDEDLLYSIAESKIYELIFEWYAEEISDAYINVR